MPELKTLKDLEWFESPKMPFEGGEILNQNFKEKLVKMRRWRNKPAVEVKDLRDEAIKWIKEAQRRLDNIDKTIEESMGEGLFTEMVASHKEQKELGLDSDLEYYRTSLSAGIEAFILGFKHFFNIKEEDLK